MCENAHVLVVDTRTDVVDRRAPKQRRGQREERRCAEDILKYRPCLSAVRQIAESWHVRC